MVARIRPSVILLVYVSNLTGEASQHLAGVVSGTIVNNNNLLVGVGLSKHTLYCFLDHRGSIICWYYDTDFWHFSRFTENLFQNPLTFYFNSPQDMPSSR